MDLTRFRGRVVRLPELVLDWTEVAQARVSAPRPASSSRTLDALRARGLACPIVGGAGIGTFDLEAASGVVTEIQAGSYVFMDADYARNLDSSGRPVGTFRHASFVLSTVVSGAQPGRAVLDAGSKARSTDSGLPAVWERPDIRYLRASSWVS